MDNINIDPSIWGPSLWNTMEALACTLNNRNRNDIKTFFDILRCILPCENCRNHYNIYYLEFPIEEYLQTPLTLLIWIYELKKKIKERQGTKIISFLEFINILIDRYDMPELQYYLDKNHEFLYMMSILNISHSKFFDKFKLSQFQKLIS